MQRLKYALLAAPLALALTASPSFAQHGHGGGHGGGGGHMGGVHMGGHPGVGGFSHGGFYGGNRFYGGYGGFGGYSPFYGGLGYGYPFGFGGLGYGLGGLGLGYGLGYGGLGYGYGGYGGYGLGYGGYGSGYGSGYYGGYYSPYVYSSPAYSAVLGGPAAVGSYPSTNYVDPSVLNPGSAPAATTATEPGPATATVIVPQGGQLWFNGKEQLGGKGVFTSQVIQPGETVTLEVKARWDGSTRVMQLPLRAGDKLTVDMSR